MGSEVDIQQYMNDVGSRARAAARLVARATTSEKNAALLAIAEVLQSRREQVLQANAEDVAAGRANGLDAALLDRLSINDKTFDGMLEGLRQVTALPDPIGSITDMSYRPSGIQVGKMRAPLGVVGIIYESRPNVTVEAASLCLKSGNACILRGGSEAIRANRVIAQCVREGLKRAGLPEDAVQVIDTTDRAAVGLLVAMPEFVDVIVPRGGKGLIERVSAEAKVPVIKHLDGICHVYVDDEADLQKASDIAFNAKCHRYGVCNAMETLLVHEQVANTFLPIVKKRYDEKQVELRGCDKTQQVLVGIRAATAEDWSTEYLAPVLAIKIVRDLDEAMTHINDYGLHHTSTVSSQRISPRRGASSMRWIPAV
ncbi:MAG: glutamate-5-semialdehyde dehydrogenase [Pseudomonadales bacterium]